MGSDTEHVSVSWT